MADGDLAVETHYFEFIPGSERANTEIVFFLGKRLGTRQIEGAEMEGDGDANALNT
jgi:hypothetical protein